MLLKLILHTKGPAPKSLPHIPPKPLSAQHAALRGLSPTRLQSHLPPLPSVIRCPFALPPASSTAVLLAAVQCCLLQDIPWPGTGCSNSAGALTICCVFLLPLHLPCTSERAACMSTSSTEHGIAPLGREFSLTSQQSVGLRYKGWVRGQWWGLGR